MGLYSFYAGRIQILEIGIGGDNNTYKAAPGELIAIFDHRLTQVATVLLLIFGNNPMLILLEENVNQCQLTNSQPGGEQG